MCGRFGSHLDFLLWEEEWLVAAGGPEAHGGPQMDEFPLVRSFINIHEYQKVHGYGE